MQSNYFEAELTYYSAIADENIYIYTVYGSVIVAGTGSVSLGDRLHKKISSLSPQVRKRK